MVQCWTGDIFVGRLSADGIQLPKRVAVRTYHILCYIICILLYCIEFICWLIPGCWQVLSPTRKESSYSDQTLTFASNSGKIQKVVHPIRSPRQQWPPRRTKNWWLFIWFLSRVGLRTCQHSCVLGRLKFCNVTCWHSCLVIVAQSTKDSFPNLLFPVRSVKLKFPFKS